MCGYLVKERDASKLRRLGVADSKTLTARRREFLFSHLTKLASDVVVFRIPANEIDSLRTRTNLNRLEIERMRQMIAMLSPSKVIIDSPEANTKKFTEKILQGMQNGFEVVAENFADANYPEVGAASIIAKVHRDREIEKLHKEYGFFGSGYTSDPRTIGFLKDWLQNNKDFPAIVRKSWITSVALKKEKEQSRLLNFAK